MTVKSTAMALCVVIVIVLIYFLSESEVNEPRLAKSDIINDINSKRSINSIINNTDKMLAGNRDEIANLRPCNLDNATIEGVIIDGKGESIDCVDIYINISSLITYPPDNYNTFKSNSINSTTNNSDGSFIIPVLSTHRYYIMFDRDGYIPRIMSSYPSEELTVVLELETTSISGKLVNRETSHPVSNALLTLLVNENTKITTNTDNKGCFVLNKTPAIINHIDISHEEYYPLKLRNWPSNDLNRTLLLRPKNGNSIYIICKSSLDGSIINHITINNKESFVDSFNRHKAITYSDSNNLFRIYSEGYCPLELQVDHIDNDKTFTVNMTPSIVGYGRVIDTSGQPIRDVKVTPIVLDEYNRYGDLLTIEEQYNNCIHNPLYSGSSSDSCGFFELENVPVKKPVALWLKKEGYVLQKKIICIHDPLLNNIGDIEYKDNSKVVGQIVDAEGNGISSAWVMLQHVDGSYVRDLSDKRGYYEIFTDSYVQMHVAKLGYEYYTLDEEVMINENETISKTIQLNISQKLYGRVIDKYGCPVPGAKLALCGELIGETRKMVSDREGNFIIDGISKHGEYYIKAFKERIPTNVKYDVTNMVTLSDQKIEVVLTDHGCIYGKLDEVNSNITNVKRICYKKPGITNWRKRTTKDGYYSLLLECGSWCIKAECDNNESKEYIVTIYPDKAEEVNLLLDRIKADDELLIKK